MSEDATSTDLMFWQAWAEPNRWRGGEAFHRCRERRDCQLNVRAPSSLQPCYHNLEEAKHQDGNHQYEGWWDGVFVWGPRQMDHHPLDLLHRTDKGEVWPSSQVPHWNAAVELGLPLIPEASYSEKAEGLKRVTAFQCPSRVLVLELPSLVTRITKTIRVLFIRM